MLQYQELLDYYVHSFSYIDIMHYNSSVAKQVYEDKLGNMNSEVIPVTNFCIKDNRRKKYFSNNGLIVGFIGSNLPYKGLQVLKRAVSGLNVDIIVWGTRRKECGRIHYRGKYSIQQIQDVYSEMDLLVVPSIWKETFSLVTLEAISYGTPVLVSNNVGAQDIVKLCHPDFIYQTELELREKISELVENKDSLISYNERILCLSWEYDMTNHAKSIIERIYLS